MTPSRLLARQHNVTAAVSFEKPVLSPGSLAMCLAPIAALVYPLTLTAFNTAVTALETGHEPEIAAMIAAFALVLSFILPALILVIALRFAEIEKPTPGQLRARKVAFLAVAAPTLFVFMGVLLTMAGNPIPDMVIWVVLWLAPLPFIMGFNRHSSQVQAPIAAPAAPTALRLAHGISALAIILMFLGMHIPNHLVGLVGPEAHASFMRVVRHIYRAKAIEPVLVGLFLFQVSSGLYLAFRHMAKPMDRFRAFQIASGMYLAFYVLGHMDSVFLFARLFLGIDTDWGFAAGAPAGLIKDPWNIRLVPHYALGVFFVLAHLSSGLRVVLLAHGLRRVIADRLMMGGSIAGGLVAALIVLAMCGMRIHFA